MSPGTSWIWTTTTTNLTKKIIPTTKRADSDLNHELANTAQRLAMDINNKDMEIIIAVSSNHHITLSKSRRTSTSKASLMSLDGPVMMTCGDIRE